MEYLQLIGGLLTLILSGKYLVKASVCLAKRIGISDLIIGMTVVAFGTSAPELLVSISAAFKGSPEISLGNVLGSNIANIGLVLATSALITPIPVQKNTIRYDWPIMFVSFILLSLLMFGNNISRFEGFILFVFLIAYIFWQLTTAKKDSKTIIFSEKKVQSKQMPIVVAIVIIVISSFGLAKGADWLVIGASTLAYKLNISERIISITIIAIGTSLPELTTSVIAALQKKTDISVGNIIGSNIFNVFSIIGITAIIHPLNFNYIPFLIDIGVMLFIGVLLWIAIYPFKSNYITRSEGFMLLLAYTLYIIFIVFYKV